MELIRFLIIGAVAGCLARTFIKGGGFGLPINIVIGIIGAVAPCVRIVVTCKKKNSSVSEYCRGTRQYSLTGSIKIRGLTGDKNVIC